MNLEQFITIRAGGGFRCIIDGKEFPASTKKEKTIARQWCLDHAAQLIEAQDGGPGNIRPELTAEKRREMYQAHEAAQ